MKDKRGKMPPGPDDISTLKFEEDLALIEKAWNDGNSAGQKSDPTGPPSMVDQAVLNLAKRELGGRRWFNLPGQWQGSWTSLAGTAAVMILTLSIVTEQVSEQAPESRFRYEESLENGTDASIQSGPPVTAGAEVSPASKNAAVPPAQSDASLRSQMKKEGAREADDLQQKAELESRVVAKSADKDASTVAESEEAGGPYDELVDKPVDETVIQADEIDGTQSAEPAVIAIDRVADDAEFNESFRQAETKLDQKLESRDDLGSDERLESQNVPQPGEDVRTHPETWLKHILSLKAAGEQELFEQEFQAFREAWPDYPLPTGLGDRN
jgi:hypothetical protein